MLLTPARTARSRFDLQSIGAADLREVAAFLHRYAHRDDAPASERPLREDPGLTERKLRWLLIENPAARDVEEYGVYARDASGGIVGLLLAFPAAFVAGDRRLRGVGSGGYFVDPDARSLGYYLFKRHLRRPDYDFCFATTCNVNSGPVWRALGASPVPHTDRDDLLPLRLDALLPALIARKTSSTLIARLARVGGRAVDAIRHGLWRASRPFTVAECRDWEKLAELARRHRLPGVTTTDRSRAYFEWRYGRRGSDGARPEVYLFSDARGREGWFALGRPGGARDDVRGCALLDAAWPRDTMRFDEMLSAIVRVAAADYDALLLRPRYGADYGAWRRFIVPRRLKAPEGFVLPAKSLAAAAVASLDLVPADGDGAL